MRCLYSSTDTRPTDPSGLRTGPESRGEASALVCLQKRSPPRGTEGDGTVINNTNVAATAREAGAAAERATELQIAKYSGLEDKCIFQPIAVESLGPLNETACQFLKDLGRRISALFQRLSVVIQRFNAILLHDSFESADHLG